MNRKLVFVSAFLFLTTAVIFLLTQNNRAVAQFSISNLLTPVPQHPEACFTDMFEPNDSCGAASALLEPGFFTPLYLCQGESDWFAIDVPAGHTLEMDVLFSHTSNSDLDLVLYSEDCIFVRDQSDSTTDNEYVRYQANADSRFYAQVYSGDPSDEGSYETQLRLSCTDCFTYQGQLKENGVPATGQFEFRFQLWDTVVAGVELSSPITYTLPVSDGLFTASLYFGAPSDFAGRHPLFIEAQVRHAGVPEPFTPLMPRQEVAAAPIAHTLPPGAVISGTAEFGPILTLGNSGPLGDGLMVRGTNDRGIVVDSTGGKGISVFNSGSDGLFVSDPAADGVYVHGAGGDGVSVFSAGGNGVYGRTTNAVAYGGYFVNAGSPVTIGVGLYAEGNYSGVPDIELGGGTGRISANAHASADLQLDANGSVILSYDQDYNGAWDYFEVQDGSASRFTVGWYGTEVWDYLRIYGSGWISDDLDVDGILSKGAGSFRIDHPLDPENMYLYHSFVESPDMMNVYNGNVALDENGEAWVELPEWFEELNRDFRYQLTPIGAPGPNLYIATPVTGNRFQIAGGAPGMTVSWQVTGIRQDPFANANRIEVEVPKPPEAQGTYLHPEAWGQPPEMGESQPVPGGIEPVPDFEPGPEEMQ